METILRLRGQISQQPGFQPDDQPNSQPEKRTDCQIDSHHNASKGQQDVSHESDIAWQVDIPFQAIQYMPPEVQAIWRGEESTMSVPGVGSIAAGRSQQREAQDSAVIIAHLLDALPEGDSGGGQAVDLDSVLTVPEDEEADDEDDLIPEPEQPQPEGPPEYDDTLVYTAGRSEISQHREEYVRYYLANRFSGFKNDQVLEMLLHFAFPQRNTALLSESLMERFGSLHGVLSAGVDLLMAVDGMTRHAAVLLDMVLQAAQRAIEEQNSVNDLLNTDEKVGEFLLHKFYGLTTETIYLLCLDNNCRLVSCTELAQGSSSTARVSVRKICETAIISKSPNVILAHNHPGGRAYPSGEDIRATSRLQGLLKMVDIDLVDHFIIAGNNWKSMAQMGELSVTRVSDRMIER